jgi:ATP:corrinoid adenosyltransferase
MKVINLFVSAGAGKSTTALGVAHNLKINGYKVEYVSEYAKQLVMSGCQNLLAYQEHVFTNQLFRMNILKDKSLDFIHWSVSHTTFHVVLNHCTIVTIKKNTVKIIG